MMDALESGGEVTGRYDSGARTSLRRRSGGDAAENAGKDDSQTAKSDEETGAGQAGKTEDGMAVIAQPADIAVLVNKQNKLPEEYNPLT